jgi:hypothetical protein
VHGDLCGPVTPATLGGRRYFLLLVDDLSRYMWLWSLAARERLRTPSGARRPLRRQSAAVSYACCAPTTTMNSHHTAQMRVFSTTTLRRTACSRTASSSGATRRLWGWLRLSSSRGECRLSSGETVVTAIYILNRSSTKALNGRTSYEAWHGRKTAVSHLRDFGCLAFAKELGHIGKLDDRSTPGVFISYAEGSKAYHILDPGTQRVRTMHNIIFDEGRGWAWDKAVDDGSTLTYDNFTVEYVHFKGAEGVGSSLPPSISTLVPEPPPTSAPCSPVMTSAATRSSPPPP